MDIRVLRPSSLGRVYRYKVGSWKALLRSAVLNTQIRKGEKAGGGGKTARR